MSDRIYCYPDSDVLMNKLNIHDAEKFQEAERKLTMLRLIDLLDKPVAGKFDFKHLQTIHKYIFQDIYPWAGKVRSVDIAKSNMFCKVQFIETQADEIFGKLKNDCYLEGLPKEKFAKKAAYYFSEINALHPFREGNGRTQREVIRSLALMKGYECEISIGLDDDIYHLYMDGTVYGDTSKLEKLFNKLLTEI